MVVKDSIAYKIYDEKNSKESKNKRGDLNVFH